MITLNSSIVALHCINSKKAKRLLSDFGSGATPEEKFLTAANEYTANYVDSNKGEYRDPVVFTETLIQLLQEEKTGGLNAFRRKVYAGRLTIIQRLLNEVTVKGLPETHYVTILDLYQELKTIAAIWFKAKATFRRQQNCEVFVNRLSVRLDTNGRGYEEIIREVNKHVKHPDDPHHRLTERAIITGGRVLVKGRLKNVRFDDSRRLGAILLLELVLKRNGLVCPQSYTFTPDEPEVRANASYPGLSWLGKVGGAFRPGEMITISSENKQRN